MDKKKKITYGILLAIILVGIIVVILKGFNVGLSLKSHDTFKFVFEQKYELDDVKNICKEVFKNKNYRIRGVEVFGDAVYIEATNITEEEQKALSEKLEKLYKKDNTETEDGESVEEAEEKNYEFFNDANIRLRDEVSLYILPISISAIIILVYIAIRFKKLNNGRIYKTLLNVIIESAILVSSILSIFAICRIPLEKMIFSTLIIIEIIYLVIKFAFMEKKLKEV